MAVGGWGGIRALNVEAKYALDECYHLATIWELDYNFVLIVLCKNTFWKSLYYYSTYFMDSFPLFPLIR